MALSFPEPVIGNVKRIKGQGCNSCVHRNYCQAFYWFLRFGENKPDDYLGIQCASWSNDEGDRITTANDDDIALNTRLNNEGLLTEPRSDGLPEGSYEAYK